MPLIEKIFSVLFLEELGVFIPTTILFLYFFFYIKVKNKNYFLKLIFFLIPIINIFYNYSFIPEYIAALGQDSILEIDSDYAEAVFYIKTLFIFLFDTEIFKRPRFWFMLTSSFFSGLSLFLIFKILSEKITNINFKSLYAYFKFFFYAAIVLVLVNAGSLIYKNYKAGSELKKITNNSKETFDKEIKNFKFKKNLKDDLLVVNYIGESTSALNFSLYGYPFETTPWLNSQKDNNQFIYFKNVFSRYTHTTPSLIDTFSVCKELDINACSNTNLKDLNFLPLVNVLEKNLITTHLYSTQGALGGHNLANKIIFDTNNKNFSGKKETKFLGNRSTSDIKDKDFFKNNYCSNENIFKKNSSDVVFLHSYAGHGFYGGYLGHTDKKKLFAYPQYLTPRNFMGKDEKNFILMQEYDTTIKYIDETLKEIISCSLKETKKTDKPLIFIYFSDHGESPSSARGHDSTRLTYEMLHVPFFIYFNESAYEKYKEKFDYLNNLKEKNLSLKMVSELFIFLFDIEIYKGEKPTVNLKKNSFKNLQTNFLLPRKDLSGKIVSVPTLWGSHNKNDNLLNLLDENTFKNQDMSISLWQLNNYLKLNNLSNKKLIKNLVCQHRANSLILQYKNSMSNGCFETDIYYLKNKTISTHDLEMDTNLIFDNFLDSKYQKNTVWMDSKNLNKNENCKFALQWFKKNSTKLESILVELPTSSIKNIYNNNEEWISCVKEIDSLENIEVAYYMNTGLLDKCSTAIKKKNINDQNLICKELYSTTENLLKKINIRSITYDFKIGKEAILNNPSFKNYKWHVWHVDNLSDFQSLTTRDNIGIILLKNNKSLNNLN
jgi:glucan phosphoethanolaminetransferase (alkaline phosphatase superfamily)